MIRFISRAETTARIVIVRFHVTSNRNQQSTKKRTPPGQGGVPRKEYVYGSAGGFSMPGRSRRIRRDYMPRHRRKADGTLLVGCGKFIELRHDGRRAHTISLT
jgi:hypothetical protein